MKLFFEDGKLHLFTRGTKWYARIYLGNRQYLTRSLKTRNQVDAERAGRKLFYRTEEKIESGQPINAKSFSQVVDEYVSAREGDASQSMFRQIQRVSQFWKEHAGAKSIESIDDAVLRSYVPFRKTYYHNKPKHPNAKLDPADTTILWEVTLGKMILKWSQEKGYRGKVPLPTWAFSPKVIGVRPHFTSNEFRTIRQGLKRWVEADVKYKSSRQLLSDFIYVLGMSGIRVGECASIKARDIQHIKDVDGRDTIQIAVRGKTGSRVVSPHIDLVPTINRLLEERDANDNLFNVPKGGLDDQFNRFLKFIGLEHSTDGKKFTLYSLRHFYAIRTLGRADIHSVARNMGTSVLMIERFYGSHAISPERVRKLGGERGEAQRGIEPIRERKSK